MPHGSPARRNPRAMVSHRHRRLQLEQLEHRSLLATASLDLSFGDSGLVETAVPLEQGSIDRPQQMVQQADGKVLVLGFATSAVQMPVIARLMPDGTRDSSFGVNGVALISAKGGSVENFAVQADGKILFGGYENSPYLARLTDTGAVDSSFGDSGYLRSIPNVGQIDQIIVQDDGKILVGGDGGDGDFVVMRLLPGGEVDLAFGQSGMARVDHPQSIQVFEMALQPDGGLVAGGMYSSAGQGTLVVARFTSAGLPDESFGQAGLYEGVVGPLFNQGIPIDSYDLATGPDGRIAAVGTAGGAQAVTKVVVLTKDGLPETSFSGDGIEHLSLGEHTVSGGVAVLGDSSVVVAGNYGPHSGASYHFLAKLTSAGALDSGWGSGGYATTDLSPSFDAVKGLLLGAGGGVLTLVDTWSVEDSNDLTVTKWLPSGVPDAAFNGSGVSTINAARPLSTVSVGQLLAHPHGGSLLIGHSGILSEQAASATRYSADGQLDVTFGSAGVQRFPSTAVPFGRGTLQPDGKLVVAVTEAAVGGVWSVYPTRYLTDGTVDPTFSVQRTGIARPGNINAQYVLAQDDGKIVVIAIDYNYEGASSLIRYLPDGQVDQTFGAGGVLDLDGSHGRMLGAVQHAGATYVLTGGGYSADQVRLLRITVEGQIDPAFGGGGVRLFDDGIVDARLLIDEQQRLIVVTAASAHRYLLNGAPDLSFGDDGTVALPPAFSGVGNLNGAAVNQRGELFITRNFVFWPHPDDLPFVRLMTDGTVDAPFSHQASAILRAHDFIDYPGVLVSRNEITIAGRVQRGLNVNFNLIRILSEERSAWTNTTNRLNVDNDPGGHVVPLDALLIINQLHLYGARELPAEGPTAGAEQYFDVNGDGYLSAIDALMVINYLNTQSFSELPSASPVGEGESGAQDALPANPLSDELMASLLWALEEERERKGP